MRLLATKTEAATMFGSARKLAAALGITPAAVSAWPEVLTQRQADEVNGAALRLGLIRGCRRIFRHEGCG